jgi:hypothetical protein
LAPPATKCSRERFFRRILARAWSGAGRSPAKHTLNIPRYSSKEIDISGNKDSASEQHKMHLLPIYRTANSAGHACIATSIRFFLEHENVKKMKKNTDLTYPYFILFYGF